MVSSNRKYVMLSFDTEEFDIPCEYGYKMPLEDQVTLSVYGLNVILDILSEKKIKATFFCTTNFAIIAPNIIRRIITDGHEVASHGCNHTNPKSEDIPKSKKNLEEMFGVSILGYRQPRMQKPSIGDVQKEYMYDASLNPTVIPGRYLNIKKTKTIHKKNGLIIIPASVSPYFRIPLFWLSLHHLPLFIYKFLLKRTLTHDGYFNTYFHPWEFIDLSMFSKLPYIIKHNTGEQMTLRLMHIIDYLKQCEVEFITYSEMAMIYEKYYEIKCDNSML